jgi:putative PIN family toxin of toxin-antitoxin system
VRAVLDPNVLIAALLSPRGAPASIITRWLAGDFELVISGSLLAELERALTYPKIRSHITAQDAADFITTLRDGAVLAADPSGFPRRSADSGDDYLIALAESERAVLVSGDRHLLDLSRELPIRTPRQFANSLNA